MMPVAERGGEQVDYRAVAPMAVDDEDTTEAVADQPSADGAEAEPAKPTKKTRRGTRGGRNRKKKPAATAVATADAEPQTSASDWEYVPMSEWGDDVGEGR